MNNAAVIVTYNRLSLLKECLACVSRQTIPFSRVIVIENHSTDGTREYLLSREDTKILKEGQNETKDSDKWIWAVLEEENLGGAGGFYQGLALAQEQDYDWVLIIDDDAMIEDDYMEKLLEKAQGQKGVHGLAGSVMTDGKIDVSHRRRITSRLLFAEGSVAEEEYAKPSFCCHAATFCGLVLSGKKMREIGLPKREYFLWYDDTEYCLRLMKCGGITVVPDAVLDHRTVLSKEGMVTKGVLHRIGWRQYYGYRNRYDTARTHLGRWSAWCVLWQYRIFYVMSCLMCLTKDAAKGRENKRILGDVIRDCRQGRLGKHPMYHY